MRDAAHPSTALASSSHCHACGVSGSTCLRTLIMSSVSGVIKLEFELHLHNKLLGISNRWRYILFSFLDIFFIYISNVLPFPGIPFRNPLSDPPSSCLYEGASPTTHRLLLSHPGIPLHWGIKHPQAQGPLLLLMSNKAIQGQHHWSLNCFHWLVVHSPGAPGVLAC